MATDLERLVVQLSADIKGYENALKRAQGVTTSQTRRIQTQFDRMNRGVSNTFAKLGGAIAAAYAAQGAVRNAQRLVDSATRIDNALKVAGLSGEELESVYRRLFDSAQRNAAPIENLVTLYGRAAIVQKELGVTSEELLSFTDRVALALRVAGTDAQTASGALLQLSQALGSGVVRAEEFNSILEGALPIAQAAAAGLEEAGGSVAKLRQLIVDGKVSSEAFFRAFEAGAPILEQKVSNAVLTIDQRLTNLGTALIDAARDFNRSSKAANTFGEAIDNVTAFVNDIDFDALITQIQEVIEAFQQGVQWANNFGRSLGEITGLDNIGKFVTGGAAQRSFMGGALTVTSSKALQERIDSAFEKQITQAGNLTEEAILNSVLGGAKKGGRLPSKASAGTFKPVSLDDFDPPSGGKKKGGGGKSSASEYARELEQIEKRTAALIAETEAQRQLNPLMNDYGYAVEFAAAKQELLTAAKESGRVVTPALSAEIERAAHAYATATAEAERLAEANERIRESAEFAKDLMKGAIDDLRSALEDGKLTFEELGDVAMNVLNKITDKLLNDVLNALFEVNGQAGGMGGILGALFGGGGGFKPNTTFGKFLGLAEGGRVSGPGSGTSDSIPAKLSNGEFVVNAAATRQHLALLERINSGRLPGYAKGGLVVPRHTSGGGASGGGVVIQNVVNNAPPGTTSRTEESRTPDDRVLYRTIVDVVKQGEASGEFDKVRGGRYGLKPMPTVR